MCVYILNFFKAKNFYFPKNFTKFPDFFLISLIVFNFLDDSPISLISNFVTILIRHCDLYIPHATSCFFQQLQNRKRSWKPVCQILFSSTVTLWMMSAGHYATVYANYKSVILLLLCHHTFVAAWLMPLSAAYVAK